MRNRIVAILAFLMLAKAQSAYAGGPVIWASPYPLTLAAGIRLQKSDGSTTCNGGAVGSIRYNAGTFEGCNGTSWSSMGASGGANTSLSNLNATTAVSQDLLPSGTRNIGASTASWTNVWGVNGQFTNQVNSPTYAPGGAATASVTLTTALTNSGNSGNSTVATGPATSGNSGNVVLSVGTASSTRGNITFKDGSEGTVGQVWTSIDTNGNGHWSAAASGASGVSSLTLATGGGLTAAATTGAITLGALPRPDGIMNCSVNGAHSGSAFIVQIYTAAGATPSATDPCTIAFRNLTAASGNYSNVNITAQASITVADTNTLGCSATITCPVYVYGVNNAGAAEIGIASFSMKNEGALQTSVGTAASTVGQLYTAGVPRTAASVRMLGEIQITLASGSHWTADPTTISNVPFRPYATDWISYSPTLSSNSGTVTSVTNTGKWRRSGDSIFVNVYSSFSGASNAFVGYYPSLPAGCVLDTTKALAAADHGAFFGNALIVKNGVANYLGVVGWTGGGGASVAVYPQSITTNNGTTGATYYAVNSNLTNAVPITPAASDTINSLFSIPCTGWGG